MIAARNFTGNQAGLLGWGVTTLRSSAGAKAQASRSLLASAALSICKSAREKEGSGKVANIEPEFEIPML